MTRDQLIAYIQATGEQARELRAEADLCRAAVMGDAVHLRGIIEFSNHCRRHCAYCGLRAENVAVRRYRMTPDEIVAASRHAEAMGMRTVVLQSGEDDWWTAQRLAAVITRIRHETALAVTLSVGERPEEDYRLWRAAGADRFLLKHETSDPELYARLHPDSTLAQRVGCLELLGELGYQIGTGCIVGLPGQTVQSLADDLLLARSLNVHMAGIGILIPHAGTPLSDLPSGSAQTNLNMMALARLLIPDLLLASTTALETGMPGGRLAGLQSGGNVIMPNATPRQYAADYDIYPGKAAPKDMIEQDVARARDVIALAGRYVATDPGHSPRCVVADRPA